MRLRALSVPLLLSNRKIVALEKLRVEHDQSAADREKVLNAQIATLGAQLGDANAKLKQLGDERDSLRKQLDDESTLAGELKRRLEELGQNVDKLASASP